MYPFPNEMWLEIIQYCDFNSLINIQATHSLLKKLTKSYIIDIIKKKQESNNHEYNIKRREYNDFERFSTNELRRYKSFICCNASDIDESSWYCTPPKELYTICYLLCLLYGYSFEKWSDIRNCLKTRGFKNFYTLLNNENNLNTTNVEIALKIYIKLHNNFIHDLKRKSYVGHIMYINFFSAIQIHLIKKELQDIENDFTIIRTKQISLNYLYNNII